MCPDSQHVAREAHSDPAALVGHRILVVHGYHQGVAALLLGRVVRPCGESKWTVVFDSVCEFLSQTGGGACAKANSEKNIRAHGHRVLRSSNDAHNDAGGALTIVLSLEAPFVLESTLNPAHPTALSWLLDGREGILQRGTFCACGAKWSPPGTWNESCDVQGCRVRRPAASLADRRLLNAVQRGLKRNRRHGAARGSVEKRGTKRQNGTVTADVMSNITPT